MYCSACTARDTLKPVGCAAQGGKGGKSFTDKVPANSRKSYTLSDVFSTGRAAILVQSQNKGLPIMVERSMYWNNRGAGTDTIGGFSD